MMSVSPRKVKPSQRKRRFNSRYLSKAVLSVYKCPTCSSIVRSHFICATCIK